MSASSTTPIRFAVLGCGRIGTMHAEMLSRRVQGAAVSVVFDVVDAAAAAVADEFGCGVAASLHDAVTAGDVDAVAICTSTDTHVDAMVAAAQAGKDIFCEKPISLSIAEVDRGLAAVEAAGVKLQIGFNRRYDPSHKAVADAVQHGAVGDVHLVNIISRDPGPPPIEYIKVSGGMFNDMTIHDFDMARYVTGSEVVEVYAKGAVRVDPAIGEAGDIDTAVVLLTHANGVLTTIDNSRRAAYGYDQRVEAFGSNGKAASDNTHQFNSVLATEQGYLRPPLENFFLERYARSYLDQWAAFMSYVRDGGPSPATGADGRAPLVIGTAALRSMQENRPVQIAEVDKEIS
ncbi:MAG: inositol 2-dehydrogenase [Ilumatobacter sp.]|uniref:inositol 2-dehydrogenase n=1 Tax=Ilumatobacter sp. TaxID=1967498 RepID=UPI003C78ABDA